MKPKLTQYLLAAVVVAIVIGALVATVRMWRDRQRQRELESLLTPDAKRNRRITFSLN